MARRAAVLVVVLLLAPLATAVEAQTVPAATAAPGAPASGTALVPIPRPPLVSAPPPVVVVTPPTTTATPGDPSNPADFTNNPHPTMPWFGVATPYGQFMRWLWVPPRFANVDGRVVAMPGAWVAQTTAGYYVVDYWTPAVGPTGEVTWQMVPRAVEVR